MLPTATYTCAEAPSAARLHLAPQQQPPQQHVQHAQQPGSACALIGVKRWREHADFNLQQMHAAWHSLHQQEAELHSRYQMVKHAQAHYAQLLQRAAAEKWNADAAWVAVMQQAEAAHVQCMRAQ
jgi:hypothetical protein